MDILTIVVLIAGAIAIGLLLLWLALIIIVGAISVAVSLFGWAAESGFVGIALYVILWVIATPLMLIVCLVGGAFRAYASWQEDRQIRHITRNLKRKIAKPAAEHPSPGEPGYLDWANRREPYAD